MNDQRLAVILDTGDCNGLDAEVWYDYHANDRTTIKRVIVTLPNATCGTLQPINVIGLLPESVLDELRAEIAEHESNRQAIANIRRNAT